MEGKMKAQMFYEPMRMQLEEVNIPSINDLQVLVKVKACGICGSDISYYYGHSPLGTADGKGPLILGHEFSGVVAEVGAVPASMGLYKPGDRVIANPVGPCFACEQCQKGQTNLCANVNTNGVNVNGAFAEYAVVPYTNLVKMPDKMSFEVAALTEPAACAAYAVKQLDIAMGDFVVVYGPGTLGLIMVQLAKSRGAGKVASVGIVDYSLSVAKEMGADYIINMLDKSSPYYQADIIKYIKSINDGKLAPRVIVATASLEAMQSALEVSGMRATVVIIGLVGPEDCLKVPVLDFIINDKVIKFSWLAPFVWPETVASISTGKLDVAKLVSHKFSLEDTVKGIDFMKNSPENKVKGIVIIN